MNRGRGCIACKAANAKCDLSRPTCGRCTLQGLNCSGLPLDAVFVFRDENEVARRNSQRARSQLGQSVITQWEASDSANFVSQGWPYQVATVTTGSSRLQQQYSWLSDHALATVPEPLKRDVETRAVERFFVNWTLHPSNHGGSPGYMHELPMLFLSVQQDSVLWLAVRAVAFADIRNENTGNVSFHTKSRQHYGAALNRMRTVINDQQNLGDDKILFSMLLIDNFELMYLGRNDPFSPHGEAIKHILRSRDDGQLYSPSRFSLWRLTHYRLQFWQTLFCEHPDAQQIAWVSKLNMEQPDLRICSYVLHMNILTALSKSLIHTNENDETMRREKLGRVKQLAIEMQELISAIEQWMSEMSEPWKATKYDSQKVVVSGDVDEVYTYPIPRLQYSQILSYDDIWLAYIWNFHASSQIVLRESLVETIQCASVLQGKDELDEDDKFVIQNEREQVENLAATILESFPQLLGFTYKYRKAGQPQISLQGRMVGRLFALFSMWIVHKAKYTSTQQRQTASDVVAWINNRHGLD